MICQKTPLVRPLGQLLLPLMLLIPIAAAAGSHPIVEDRGKRPDEVFHGPEMSRSLLLYHHYTMPLVSVKRKHTTAILPGYRCAHGITSHPSERPLFLGADPDHWHGQPPTWSSVENGGNLWNSSESGLTVICIDSDQDLPSQWPWRGPSSSPSGTTEWLLQNNKSRAPNDDLVWSTFPGGVDPDKGLGRVIANHDVLMRLVLDSVGRHAVTNWAYPNPINPWTSSGSISLLN